MWRADLRLRAGALCNGKPNALLVPCLLLFVKSSQVKSSQVKSSQVKFKFLFAKAQRGEAGEPIYSGFNPHSESVTDNRPTGHRADL